MACRHLRGVIAPLLLSVALPSIAAEHIDIDIRDYRFAPSTVRIRVGDTERWTNREVRTSHSIYFTGPDSFESERLFPGEQWSRRFDTPGRHPYRCGPHPEMEGSVDVLPD